MAEHLSSAFAEGDIRLYEGNTEENIERLWAANCEENANQMDLQIVELFDVIAAINRAKTTKDPGIMAFSRILVGIYNGCYNLGWLPENCLKLQTNTYTLSTSFPST